jgi:hypothetical protein
MFFPVFLHIIYIIPTILFNTLNYNLHFPCIFRRENRENKNVLKKKKKKKKKAKK